MTSPISPNHPQYRVLQTSGKTWQIYKLWTTNPDGTAEYMRYPDATGDGNLEIWTDKEAAEAKAEQLTAGTDLAKNSPEATDE